MFEDILGFIILRLLVPRHWYDQAFLFLFYKFEQLHSNSLSVRMHFYVGYIRYTRSGHV